MRTLAVWCPDWPVAAALAELAESDRPVSSRMPAAVLANNVVQVCNAAARAEGVRRGQRRRDAQARCPELVLLAANPERDARFFEPVLALIEDIRPGVAPLRPGLLAVSAPGRFHCGEAAAVALIAEHLVAVGVWDCRFGVADDLFAAVRAAKQAQPQDCVVVPPGRSAEFLRGLPVEVLADDGAEGRELADLLRRLGLSRLREFAAFEPDAVSSRFGGYGADVWRRATGRAVTTLASRTPPPDLDCEVGFEPPLESAEAVCFSVRTTAEKFIAQLAERQLVVTAVHIEATYDEFGGGGVSARTWVHPRCFTSRDLVDRVHWQLQGASSGVRSRRAAGAVTAPVERVRFLPEVVEPAADHADGLWGGGAAEQVVRGVARVQAMLGYDAVRVPVVQGGRSAADRQVQVVWGEQPRELRARERPWPGAIPGPAPSRVFDPPLPAEVVDATGRSVAVTDRGRITGEPVSARWSSSSRGPKEVECSRGPKEVECSRGTSERIETHWQDIAAWAGPWPVDDAWWLNAESEGRTETTGRSARFQVVGVDGRAWLLVWRAEGWSVAAAYD